MKPTEDVVQMSYYRGSLGPDFCTDLYVCVERLANGQTVASINAMSPLSQVVRRGALCVRGSIILDGQPCMSEQYIARWRNVQAYQPTASLDAWFATDVIETTVYLPAPDATHHVWLSPLYPGARDRLFGAGAFGAVTARLCSRADLLDAKRVITGLAAYGITNQSLNKTLRVSARAAQTNLVAMAA